MTRIVTLLALLSLSIAQAQDAAVEERLNRLNVYIEELQAAKVNQDKRIATLTRELEAVRDVNKTGGTVATQDDIQRLAEAIKEVDRKRLEDYEKIHRELERLAKAFSVSTATPPRRPERDTSVRDSGGAGGPDKGYEHIIASGDTLSTIAEAYRLQLNLKVTVEDIMRANPGLKPTSLPVGKKIFIPAEK